MAVYMIRAGKTGPVKIGHSNDPAGRLIDLQVSHYEQLYLLRVWYGSDVEEAALHIRFADLHIRGEWFGFSRLMLGDVGLIPVEAEVEEHRAPFHAAPIPGTGQIKSQLLHDIELFIAEQGMAESTFGRLAVNDGKFVRRLRDNRAVGVDLIDRAVSFMFRRRESASESGKMTASAA